MNKFKWVQEPRGVRGSEKSLGLRGKSNFGRGKIPFPVLFLIHHKFLWGKRNPEYASDLSNISHNHDRDPYPGGKS